MKKLLFSVSVSLLAFTACNFKSVKGDGHMISKTYAESGFKDIQTGSVMKVYLKQGPDYSIRIDGEENMLQFIRVRTDKDRLVIGLKDNININPTRDIKVYITAPDFRNLDGSGACDFISDGTIKGNQIKIELSGASSSQLDVDVNKLEVDASGASEINLRGKAVYFSVDGSGNTSVRSFPMLAEYTSVAISGSGDAEVTAGQSLKVNISGAGSIKYKGSPTSVKKDISGAGEVTRVD